jgi:hypothetical protein
MTEYCEFCGKGPFPTHGGLNKHIGRSKDCHGKSQLAFNSYTSTLWKNAPDARNDLPSSSPPPTDETLDAQFEDLEHDLLSVEQNISLDPATETPDLPIPQTPQRNRVTIEEVSEEEETRDSGHYFEEYPTDQKAGAAWGEDQPLFMRTQREQQENGTSKWGPFKDQGEWELAEWLSKNVGQKQTDAFLKLNIVSTYNLVPMPRAVSFKLTEQHDRPKIARNHPTIAIGTS